MELFCEEEVMGVDESSERLAGLVWTRGERTVVVRDIFTLVFPASDEVRVEEGSGFRVRREVAVHLGVFGEFG